VKRELSSEEILKLPKDEFIEYMNSVKKRTYKANFLSSLPNDYQRLGFDEKVKFWVENLHQGMRLQVEKGYDEYSTYTPEWHKTFREVDSNVDEIMEEVFRTFYKCGWAWNKQEYLKRISKPTL
jgi:hypothetical protein